MFTNSTPQPISMALHKMQLFRKCIIISGLQQ